MRDADVFNECIQCILSIDSVNGLHHSRVLQKLCHFYIGYGRSSRDNVFFSVGNLVTMSVAGEYTTYVISRKRCVHALQLIKAPRHAKMRYVQCTGD